MIDKVHNNAASQAGRDDIRRNYTEMDVNKLLQQYRDIKLSPCFSTQVQRASEKQANEIRSQIERAGYIIKESRLLNTYELERKEK